MVASINASTSAGVVTTADTSGILALQTAGTTAVSISASQVVTLTNALPVASGGSGVTTSTGTGANVLGTSPTIATPTMTGQATIPTINLTGGQITFPATQSASSNANTLDDYEEGTWTPSLGGNTTYAAQVGTYTKIGKIVYVSAYLIVTTIGTGSTTYIDGLPFSGTTTSSAGGIVAFSGLASAVTFLSLSAENGTTRLSNRYTTSNTTAAASNGALYTSGSDLQVWALFFTS